MSNFCLHPEFVSDLVENLLANDIISKNEISRLKNDTFRNLDPIMLMELRHEQTRKTPIIKSDQEHTSTSTRIRRNQEKPLIKSLNSVKDLKVIDKEIEITKKHLALLKNQLSRNNDSLITSITNLEQEGKPSVLSASPEVYLKENEIKKYFELHLDSLENKKKLSKNKPNISQNMWTPLELASPSVNTSLKPPIYNQLECEFDEEELNILELFELKKPMCIMGKPVEQVSFCDKIKKQPETLITSVPNNSPELGRHSEKSSFSSKERIIARKCLKKWKAYVKLRQTQEFSDYIRKKSINYLLKEAFTTWFLFAQCSKSRKDSKLNLPPSHDVSEHFQANHANFLLNKIEICDSFEKLEENEGKGKKVTNQCLKSKENKFDSCFTSKPSTIFSKNCTIKHCVISKVNKNSSVDCESEVKTFENRISMTNNQEITKIHSKIVTPECVGLTANSIVESKPQNIKSDSIEKNEIKKNHRKSLKNIEAFSFRYAAQEKIISQQLALIDKQNQIILDLQAENLKTKSTLQKIAVERELSVRTSILEKEQTFKIKCNAVGIIKASDTLKGSDVVKEPCMEDKSLDLTNRMLLRQEYCKTLAEKTKMRKKRIEEEKVQIIMELEEKEKIAKEERKKQRLKQIRLEKNIAKENAKLNLVKNQRINELTEIAVKHYNVHLIGKMFQRLKQNSLEIHFKAEECIAMFEKKLIKKTFILLKTYVNESKRNKAQAADQFYKDKLIERCWCSWRELHHEYKIKVQVSFDMFELSLQRRVFHKWQNFTAEQYLQTCYKIELANRFYVRKQLQQSLKIWREFPRLMLSEREREQRRRVWHHAVQELIPDFTPVSMDHHEI